jgi:hypothetical protein
LAREQLNRFWADPVEQVALLPDHPNADVKRERYAILIDVL